MKKLFTLAVLAMLTIGVGAQEKKSWNFAEGLSDETIANLNADAANWASNGTDGDGNTNNWKNAVKQSADGYWMANGEVIEELRGLKIDIGSNKDNSVHLATTKLRLTRKNTKITFPKLANGQTVKIVGRSANSTATNRGIAAVQDHLVFQSDLSSTQTDGKCIFLGNQVEGSEGTYTFVWKVETAETDSVDVQFQLTPDAGIDFTLFQIDNGDAPDVEGALPVAYLYNGDLDSDYAYIYLSGASEKFALTEVNVAETTADADSLRKFMGVVISPTIGATDAFLPVIKQTIAFVPVLNLNPNLYEALGYGKAVESNSGLLDILEPEFGGFEGMETSQPMELLSEGYITGVELGDYFANDLLVATAGERSENIVAMHVHNVKRNAYVLLPLTLENMPAANQDNISQLIPQTLQTVIATKKNVVPVGSPVIGTKQENGFTTISITATNSNAIYYTTDGSEPTTASTLYTEPFNLYAPTTVKALATGDGYTDSNIASKEIVIMTQAAAPTISIEREAGKSTITITATSPDATVYYNYTGSTVLTESATYTEPIVLTHPATIYAFANGGGFLTSEVTEKFVGIDGLDNNTIRWDIAGHFDANAENWKGKGQQTDGEGNIINANYFFTWGKDAGTYWDETTQQTVTAADGVSDSIIYTKTLQPETYEAEGWRIKSIGQVVVWESLDYKYNIGDTNYRNPDTPEDVIGANDSIGITRDAITFGKQPTGGPFNASLESTQKYQAPFDIVIYAGNGNEGAIPTMQVEVSPDGETWTKVGDVDYSLIKRNWKRTQLSYEAIDQVYVRIIHTNAKSSGQIYDLYVMNNGQKSQQYTETPITTPTPEGKVIRTQVYTLHGTRTANTPRGIAILRETYANGAVRTTKIVNK